MAKRKKRTDEIDRLDESIEAEFERLSRYMDEALEAAKKRGFSIRIQNGKAKVHVFDDFQEELETDKKYTEVTESDTELAITLEFTGVRKDDIKLEIDEDYATIAIDTETKKYYKKISFPCKVEPETARATYRYGVLDITVRKKCKS